MTRNLIELLSIRVLPMLMEHISSLLFHSVAILLVYNHSAEGSFCGSEIEPQELASTTREEIALPRKDLYGDSLPMGATTRFGTVRLRTEQGAMSIAFSPDGSELISSDWSPRVRFWDVNTGRETRRLDLGDFPDAAMLSSDGSHVIINRLSGVSLRKLPDGEFVFSNSQEQGNNRSFALTDDKAVLATFPSQKAPSLIDTATGTVIWKPKFDVKPTVGSFSPNGQFMAVCDSRKSIQVWGLYQGKPLLQIASANPVRWESVLFVDDFAVVGCGNRPSSLNGKRVSVANIEMWNLDNPTQSSQFQLNDGDVLVGMAMSISRDRSLLAVSYLKNVIVWRIADQKPICVIENDNTYKRSVAISPDNSRLALGGQNHKLEIWNIATGNQELPQVESHHGAVLSMALSPTDGKLVSTGEEGTTRLWDLQTGEHQSLLHRNSGWTRDVQFFEDGKRVMVCGEYHDNDFGDGFIGKAAIIDVSQGSLIREWKLSARGVKLALNKEGSLAAIAVGIDSIGFGAEEPPPEIQVWDLRTFEIISKSKEVNGKVTSIVFERDDLIRFTTNTGGYVWDTSEQKPQELFQSSSTNSIIGQSATTEEVLISPDKLNAIEGSSSYDRTAKKSAGRLRSVSVVNGKEGWSLNFPSHNTREFAITQEGEILAVYLPSALGSDKESRLELFSMKTGKSLLTFGLPGLRIRSMMFSSDGKTLYTGMDQGDILRWDVSAAKSSTR